MPRKYQDRHHAFTTAQDVFAGAVSLASTQANRDSITFHRTLQSHVAAIIDLIEPWLTAEERKELASLVKVKDGGKDQHERIFACLHYAVLETVEYDLKVELGRLRRYHIGIGKHSPICEMLPRAYTVSHILKSY